jgi:acetyl-CoA carboxylase, biotin carboxylase subunit
MFQRILVANRGEIALRIIRACKEMGIQTVAVYSEVDEDSLHLRYADETICIGPGPSLKSYLDITRIIAAAEIADVDAVHPGYGFLSERARFAEVCRACKLVFIGPSPETIEAVGNKARARELAAQSGVPTIPGSEGLVADDKAACEVAAKIGYPVLIKAAAGGGGRGMRVAHSEISLRSGFAAAKAEASTAFGDDTVYVEKFIERPRHVEIQIIADSHGNFVHLGERDCSVQRRHQKLVEESPSPVLTPELRRKMGEAAIRFAKAGNYVNAGTVEFLVDKNLDFYFMEMNSRIQVEHPVTEVVTGIDLVKEQIRIAAGERLSFGQDDVVARGHAIEVRVNAEDPANDFRPNPGRVTSYVAPGGPGIRVDSHLYTGYTVPPHYDSLLAKVIAFRPSRAEAIDTLSRALGEMTVEGVKTTIPFLLKVLNHAEFRSGNVDTSFVEAHRAALFNHV